MDVAVSRRLQLAVLVGTLLILCEGRQKLPCSFPDSVNITNGRRDSDGSILHNNIRYKPENYATIDYTVEYGERIQTHDYTRGCICQVSNCVWLCCNNFTDVEGYPTCSDPEYENLIVEVIVEGGGVQPMELMSFNQLHKALRLPDGVIFEGDDWSMNSLGYIVASPESGIDVSHEKYCFAVDDNCTILVHSVEENSREPHRIGLIISIPFLLATLLVYSCLSELQNIHGKSLICYVLGLTCTFIVLICLFEGLANTACMATGYLFYFWTLVSFFWLNVMCFDIFWTFSSGMVVQNERKRFLYYSLYAWGCPALITGLMAIIDYVELVPVDFKPQFGMGDRCFVNADKLIEFIYFYSILVLLTVINVYFFVVTAVRIARIQRATKVAFQHGSRRHSEFDKDRYRFSLYLRLFVIMGVTWTFEMLSWATGRSDYLFYVTDISNCLLGVIIFVLFVCKKKVGQLMMKRLRPNRGLRRAKSTSFQTTTSDSRRLGSHEKIPLKHQSINCHETDIF